METKLRILYLEDEPLDAELVHETLTSEGIASDIIRVETREEFELALDQGGFDLILSDKSLPAFDGLSALALAREKRPDLPYIFVSGTLGEEAAIESLKNGATDYVLKQRLRRLVPVTRRALREAEEHRERQRAEENLRESEQRFRALIEHSADAIALFGPDGTILYGSPSTTKVLGYELDEFVGRNAFEFINEWDHHIVTSGLNESLQRPGVGVNVPARRVLHKDGSWRWLEGVLTNLLDEPGVHAIVNNYRDVTERKLAEEALAASEAELRALFAAMTDVVLVLDAQGRYLQIAPSNPSLLYKPSVDLLGRTIHEVLPPDDADNILQTIRLALGEKRPVHVEYSLLIEGALIWFDATVSPMGEDKVFWIARDITERKKAEETTERLLAEVQYERKRLGTILSTVPGVVWEAWGKPDEATQRIDFVSDYVETMLGYSVQEWLSTPNFWLTIVHPEDYERIGRLSADYFVRGKGGTLQFRWIGKDNRVVWVQSETTVMLDDEGRPLGMRGVNMDITERKQAEMALQNSEKRFRALIENSSDGITLLSVNGTLAYASDSTHRILGYSSEEIIGHDPMQWIHPDDQVDIGNLLGELIGTPGGVATSLYRVRHKDGSWRWIESTINNLLAEPAVQAVVFNYRDVTERKRAEEETLQYLNRLAALRNIDLAISANLDLRVTLNVLLDQVTHQLGVDAANILLLDPHAQMLQFAAGRGFRSREVESVRLRLGEGYAGQALLERRVVGIPNLSEAEDALIISPILASEGFMSYYGAPLIAKGQIKGVLQLFHRDPLAPDQRWIDFFEVLAGQAAIAIDNAQLFDDLQRSNTRLSLAYETTLEGWSRALDLRDKETEGHTQRVTEMTLLLAQAMGIEGEELAQIRRGALLHDIGKMGIPDSILLKPGPLTDDEWVIMRKHPVYAFELISPITYLRPALDIPYAHHEKWDGTGYPRGLKGEQIPLAARIFAIVDVWDALRSDRPYRAAWPEEKTRAYIREQSGTHFDPEIVEIFLKVI
ncbi:MAG TPA: PAS domain S-box protein [Chloroflexia bacterium]|nr:PAS domain S-box protein [Chloroflexia bacterium]